MICPLRITTLKIDNIVIHFEFPHFQAKGRVPNNES